MFMRRTTTPQPQSSTVQSNVVKVNTLCV